MPVVRPLRLVEMQLTAAAAANREEFAAGSEPPVGETSAGTADDQARRCIVCAGRHPCFGFGPPLHSKGTVWACGTHRAEVDRIVRDAGSYWRFTFACQEHDIPPQPSLF